MGAGYPPIASIANTFVIVRVVIAVTELIVGDIGECTLFSS